jgi:hypothetical protein
MMRRKILGVPVLLGGVLAGLVGCGKKEVPADGRVVEAGVTTRVAASTFQEQGCTLDPDAGWACGPTSPVSSLCGHPTSPPAEFAAFRPVMPMLVCPVSGEGMDVDMLLDLDGPDNLQNGPKLAPGGCRNWSANEFVVLREGQVAAVRSPAELRALVAPIESPEEALAYAMAITGAEAVYSVERVAGLHYLVDKLEATHVERSGDAFEMNLFDNRICGHGTPGMSYRYRVWPDGRLDQVGEPTAIWDDPGMGGSFD